MHTTYTKLTFRQHYYDSIYHWCDKKLYSETIRNYPKNGLGKLCSNFLSLHAFTFTHNLQPAQSVPVHTVQGVWLAVRGIQEFPKGEAQKRGLPPAGACPQQDPGAEPQWGSGAKPPEAGDTCWIFNWTKYITSTKGTTDPEGGAIWWKI